MSGQSSDLIKVEGIKQLRSSMRKAGMDLSQLKSAHAEAGSIAASAARARAPIGPTGKLSASIRSSGTNTAAIVRAGKKAVPYAGPIHWGWPSRGIAANTFMSDGATATENQWMPIFERAVEDAIKQVKGI